LKREGLYRRGKKDARGGRKRGGRGKSDLKGKRSACGWCNQKKERGAAAEGKNQMGRGEPIILVIHGAGKGLSFTPKIVQKKGLLRAPENEKGRGGKVLL